MKLIIAGSRHLKIGTDFINSLVLYYGFDTKIKEVVCGGAEGADKAGKLWCQKIRGLCGPDSVQLAEFNAEWEKYGSRAGPIRNNKMAVYGDALLLIWDGKSAGSQHMKNAMIKLKKPVYEVILRGE